MINVEEKYKSYLSGDEKAFDDVLNALRNSLTLFINRYVRSLAVAEDLAIDTFMELIVHKHRYNFKVKLKTYLFTIGKRKALDFLKHQNKFEIVNIDDYDRADLQSLEDSVIRSEESKAVYSAIDTLPEDMKTAVYLFYIEDLSYKETAKVIKKSVKQVDNLLYRGKNILKKRLELEGVTI